MRDVGRRMRLQRMMRESKRLWLLSAKPTLGNCEVLISKNKRRGDQKMVVLKEDPHLHP